jgi:Ca2+-binding RTX toxin-like protein
VTAGVSATLRSVAGGGAEFVGTAGDDSVVGGSGDDRIAGGEGADVLRGGAGADTFVFQALDDISTGTLDRIYAFDSGIDRIDLSAIDADGDASNGDTAFTFLGSAAFTGTAGEINIGAGNGVVFVQFDTDGDKLVDLSFLVRGDVPVASDFLL